MSGSRDFRDARPGEAGFTLIEALIAMIILIFGLIAIANLFVVAASSNQIANYTTVSTANASDVLEKLKSAPFMSLVTYGGPYTAATPWLPADWEDADFATSVASNPDCVTTLTAKDSCVTSISGIGGVVTHWKIIDPAAGGTATRFILVQSEVRGLLGRGTKSQFSTFRACISDGCP